MFFFGQENISQRRWEMCTSQIFQGSVYLVVYEHREEILPLPEKFTSALAACFTTDAALQPFPFFSFLRSTLLYSIINHDKLPGLRYPPSLSFQRTTRRRAPRWAPTTATTPSSTSPRWELWFSSPFATVSSPSARSLVSKWLRRLGGHLQ